MSGGTVSLRAQLARAERLRRWRAFGLVAPLFFFLIIVFVAPIGDMLLRSTHDVELRDVWPKTAAALAGWTDHAHVPDEAAFAALAADMRSAKAAGTLAVPARRLNYAVDGGRTLVFNTQRKLPETADKWTDAFLGADPRWGDVETWNAIDQAAGPFTSYFMLAAMDRQKHADGSVALTDANRRIYLDVLARTFLVSAVVTALCLLLGFPVAYLLATQPPARANLLMILVLLPFWTSLLVRTAAWIVVLQEHGLVNDALIGLGLIERPLRLIYNRTGVYIAMTHVLLPFAVLPLYSVMKGVNPVYMRAALSLGARPTVAFLRVYLPQTTPGVAAGGLLVFILALGYYITPELIGGASDQMLSHFIAYYTADTVNWGMASALGALLLASTLALYALYNRLVGPGGVRTG
ncbi:MAG: ABC transporter permease [Roseiarcus sp.]|jgi:putative spermidine/putrescine transport system permease protein